MPWVKALLVGFSIAVGTFSLLDSLVCLTDLGRRKRWSVHRALQLVSSILLLACATALLL